MSNLSNFKNKFYGLCIASVLTMFMTACSSDKDPQPRPILKFANTEKVNISWSDGGLAKSPSGSFVPVIDNNTLFTADSSGKIFRIDPTDGTIISKFKFKRKFSSGTAVSPDGIFVTTEDGYLLAVNKATGEIKWQAQLPTVAVEAPQVGGSVVLVRTNDAEVLAYNATNGSLLWVYQKANPPLTLRTYNTFQVVGSDVALLGQPGGRLALVNINNGVPIWETYVAVPEGATDLDKLTDVSVRPIINEKEICVATFNGKLSCLDAISSTIIWAKKFSTSYGILMDEQNVYAIAQDGIAYAYDKYTGAKVWDNDTLQYRDLSSPVFLGSNILVIDSDGFINLFARSDGKLVARVKSNLKGGVSFPWADGKKAILQSGDGNIAAVTQ